MNILPGVFYDAMVSMEPLCSDNVKSPKVIKFKYSLWIPSKQYLIDMGVNYNGYWPENAKQAQQSLKGKMKDGVSWFYGYNVTAYKDQKNVKWAC